MTAAGPEETKIFTVVLRPTSVPAVGFWLITVSIGTVSLGWRCGSATSLAWASLAVAVSMGSPTTRGTATLGVSSAPKYVDRP